MGLEEVLRRRSPWRRRRRPGEQPAAVGGVWGRLAVAGSGTRAQARQSRRHREKEEAGGGISEERRRV